MSDRERVCRVCERIWIPGHPWVTVEKHGARPESWGFCSIECLGSYFEGHWEPPLPQLKDTRQMRIGETPVSSTARRRSPRY